MASICPAQQKWWLYILLALKHKLKKNENSYFCLKWVGIPIGSLISCRGLIKFIVVRCMMLCFWEHEKSFCLSVDTNSIKLFQKGFPQDFICLSSIKPCFIVKSGPCIPNPGNLSFRKNPNPWIHCVCYYGYHIDYRMIIEATDEKRIYKALGHTFIKKTGIGKNVPQCYAVHNLLSPRLTIINCEKQSLE